jgi:hypothetical protein
MYTQKKSFVACTNLLPGFAVFRKERVHGKASCQSSPQQPRLVVGR